MNTRFARLGFWVFLVFVPAASGLAETVGELARTASFAASLQNSDGGFSAKGGDPSTLGATSSAIRSLKNVGGSIRDVQGCVDFVQACRDPKTGGFSARPGGEPDVRTTSIGLMAEAELLILDQTAKDAAIEYLNAHVKTFEDVRIAVAGLESAKAKSAKYPQWIELVNAGKNADGTYGKGPDQARDTGGSAVALLRMGAPVGDRSAVLAALKQGQRGDGGWGKGEGASDLETSYRVMRCFFMLKEAPDLEKVLGLLAHCRTSEGGYSVSPGKPADESGTYFATNLLRWSRELGGEQGLVETAGFTSLSDGRDLDGWEGDTSIWSAHDGMIVGKSQGLKHNDFLATKDTYGDFVLKVSFRLVGGSGNSGIMFRASRSGEHEMSGFQADAGEKYWGCLYDESRRNKVLVPASQAAVDRVRSSGWNHYVIRAIGDTITLNLNGVESVKYVEKDAKIVNEGKIGLQVHAGGPIEVDFKDLFIQRLPAPREDGSTAFGFHLRTLKSGSESRKYTIFIPKGYDGSRPIPVVLFLHGSGERGEDGVVPAQVGLGSAIAQRPEAFPFLAVFPQARKTWAANSDDAKAALAALDDVMANFCVDPQRVVLTGLSMGGRGAWEIAAAHPDRFAGVAPVCGMGRPESAESIKAMPVWCFVGDADRPESVLNARSMIAALKKLDAQPRSTEYRGVGHNSWDRAYNDPDLLDWLVARKREPR